MADFKASTLKSLRNFEGGGVVGLGIVAAMNDLNHTHDSFFSAKSSRAAILAVSSPRSNPIPIVSNSVKPAAKFSGPILGKGEMEMSESYTCVISHFGNNLVKKREYFDDDDKPLGSHAVTTTTPTTTTNENWVSSGVFSTSPPLEGRGVADSVAVMTEFQTADFLNSCYLCKKKLHGLDIFMYRGEKAFCSAECRYKQISSDEHKEKCGSGAMKSFEYSASPCSGPMLFFAGVAAA